MSVRDWIETRWGSPDRIGDAFGWSDSEPRLAWIEGPVGWPIAPALRLAAEVDRCQRDRGVERRHAFVVRVSGERALADTERALRSEEFCRSALRSEFWPARERLFICLEVSSQPELELLLPRLLQLPCRRRALLCRDFVPSLGPWDVCRTPFCAPFRCWRWDQVEWPAWIGPLPLRKQIAGEWAAPWEWAAHVAEVGAPVMPVNPSDRDAQRYVHVIGGVGVMTDGARWEWAELDDQPDREPRPLDWLIIEGTDGDDAGPISVDFLSNLARSCALTGVPLWLRTLGRWRPGIPSPLLEGTKLAGSIHPTLVDAQTAWWGPGGAGQVEVAAMRCTGASHQIEWRNLTRSELRSTLERPWNRKIHYANRTPVGVTRPEVYVSGCELVQGPHHARPCIAPDGPDGSRLWTPGPG